MAQLRGAFTTARILLACWAWVLSLHPTFAQPLQSVSVIVFPGGFNWPIWVAQEHGYFAKNGVEVTLTNTPNSVFQLTNLIDGKFDIAVTAIDNVIAYVEGQGEVPVAATTDLFAFMGGDNGLLSLTSVPEVKSYADLKGHTVSVDAMTTGYAFVLFDMLRRHGLNRGDYRVEKAGGVLARWQALQARQHDATLLATPFDVLAKAAGFNVLEYAIDVYGHYQGLVGATRRAYARDHQTALIGYIRGYLAGLAWLYDPHNGEAAAAILRKNMPQMSESLAQQSDAVLVSPRGFAPRGQIDLDGVRTVLELRSRYGEPRRVLADPAKYYDPQYYQAALTN
jgi:ABC-type nitrate/sulfonate/bicarbonate transport system substrate-binding protein